MIRLALFESYYHLYHGNSKYMTLLAKYLNRAIFEPTIVVAGKGPLEEQAKRQGLDVLVLPYPPTLAQFGKRLTSASSLQLMRIFASFLEYNQKWLHLIKNRDFDIVHCTSIRSILSVGLGTKMARKKLTWVIQMEYSLPILDTFCMLLADKIIFNAEGLKKTKSQFLLNQMLSKIEVVPLGVDLDRQLPDGTHFRELLGIPKDTFVIGTLASIVPLKGLHFLVEAIHLLTKRGIDVICLIIGGTPAYARAYENQLRDKVVQFGLHGKVQFLGWREDAAKLISYFDVFALPSLSEGLSRATVEAMWMAKPVIVSNTGAMADLVDDSVGRLIPKANVQALAKAIEYFYSNPEARRACGKAARARVIDHYSLNRHIAKMEKIFLSVLS